MVEPSLLASKTSALDVFSPLTCYDALVFVDRLRNYILLLGVLNALPGLIVLLTGSSLSAQETSSTRKEFKEYARLMSGRFTSEIKLIHDWPGHNKKKGDLISGVRLGRTSLDGEALLLTDAAGAGILKEICAYNASTKQIESFIVFNGGTVFHCVTWKETSNKWNCLLYTSDAADE